MKVVEHAHVHVHLPNILVCEFAGFEVEQRKALQDMVIEYKIDIEGFCFSIDPVLAFDKAKSFSQFEQKIFEVFDECGFDIFFVAGLDFGDFEEFEYIGVFDDVGGGFFFRGGRLW